MITKYETVHLPILKQIAMETYDNQIDPLKKCRMVRFLMERYLREKSFIKRAKNGYHIYVIKEANQVVGFYELQDNGLLASLYVLPNYQHKGYGKLLISHAISQAKNKELDRIYLDSTPYAKNFYEHLGFKAYQDKKVMMKMTLYPMELTF